MKVRLGFVSNSSTTSFCIYGFSDDQDTIKEKLEKMGHEVGDLYDFVESQDGLEIHVEPWGDYAYIGADFGAIPDDVTVGDWKKEKEAQIQKVFGEDVSCSVIEEGWRDG